MNINHGNYKVLVLYSGDYLSGSFYDAVEYALFLQDKNIDTGVLFIVDIPKTDVLMTIKNRYQSIPENIHIEKKQKNHVYRYFSDILLTTSIFSAADIMNGTFLMPTRKIFAMQETTDSGMVQKAFNGLWKDKITVLKDFRDKTIKILEPYNHIDYKKKLYFKRFKPISGNIDKCTLINMSTKHKLVSPDILMKIIDWNRAETGHKNKYLIYCQKDTYEPYKDMKSATIDVQIAPLENYWNRFDAFLYIQSSRNDPSPRIMPECLFYNKKLYFYEFDKEKQDGAYWRWVDCQNDWNSIVLKKKDKITEVLNV